MAELSSTGLILQHGDDGPPALFAAWLERRGIPHAIHRVWEEQLPPDPSDYAWICSLGSEHTPGKEGRPEWVDLEITFLERALEAETPILGLCFGGQALAAAAGGEVAASDPPEVAWQRVESALPDLVPEGPWLHFHYDQLEVPAEAEVIARSPAGAAAFRIGPHLGLQFHPEATPAIANEWAAMEYIDIAPLGVTPEQIAAQGEASAQAAEVAAETLFDAWWRSLTNP